jgi:hypothetical protein
MLGSILSLSYSPISNYEFSHLKEEKVFQQHIGQSKLYMVCQRPQIKFNLISLKHNLLSFEIFQGNSNKRISGKINLFQKSIIGSYDGEVYIRYGTYQNRREVIENLPCHNIDGFKIEKEDGSLLCWLSPEKLFYEYSKRNIKLDRLKGWQKYCIYNVLYIGQATKQEIWKRLTGHETLQQILSLESPLTEQSIPTHEIAILLFEVHSSSGMKVYDLHSDSNNIEDLDFKNNNINTDSIILDAEKLFIKILSPKYNSIKFDKYPRSKDGLYQYNLNDYFFCIKEPLTLLCSENRIKGSSNLKKSDIILVSKNETVKIITN